MTSANKNYLGAILAGLGIIIFWVFVMSFWNDISPLNQAIKEREQLLLSRKEIIQKLKDLYEQYQTKTEEVKKISIIIPETKNLAEIISTLENISQEAGMKFFNLSISDIKRGSDQGIETLSINFNLTGTYNSFIIFLDLIERNFRLMDVVNFNVDLEDKTGLETGLLNFKLQVDTYYLGNLKN
jgi:Tfp pilus assembly protein PilO